MTDERDRIIRKLRAQVATRDMIINTLRELLFTAWNLATSFERNEEDNDDETV